MIYRDETELEIEVESVYKPNSPLDMPIRPTWTYEMTREHLEQQERNYFQVIFKVIDYLLKLLTLFFLEIFKQNI